MAGANMSGGSSAGTQEVPAIGGAAYRAADGLPVSAPVAASAHLTDGNRAEGVAYPEAFGSGPSGSGYPAGTAMTDNTPSDDMN